MPANPTPRSQRGGGWRRRWGRFSFLNIPFPLHQWFLPIFYFHYLSFQQVLFLNGVPVYRVFATNPKLYTLIFFGICSISYKFFCFFYSNISFLFSYFVRRVYGERPAGVGDGARYLRRPSRPWSMGRRGRFGAFQNEELDGEEGGGESSRKRFIYASLELDERFLKIQLNGPRSYLSFRFHNLKYFS